MIHYGKVFILSFPHIAKFLKLFNLTNVWGNAVNDVLQLMLNSYNNGRFPNESGRQVSFKHPYIISYFNADNCPMDVGNDCNCYIESILRFVSFVNWPILSGIVCIPSSLLIYSYTKAFKFPTDYGSYFIGL